MNKDYFILVVEDSGSNLCAITEILGDAGYTAEGAENGKEALDKCSKKSFDLFVIDVIMPEMSGLELLRQLNVFDHTYEAIMISEDENLEIAKKSMEYRAFGYVGKSEGRDAFLAMVVKALETVCMKKKRLERIAALEKKVSDRSAELESMVRLLEYQGRQIDSIINSMGEGIVAIDNKQFIVLMNRPAEQITGVRFAECAGMMLSNAFKSLGFADRLLLLIEKGSALDKELNIISIPRKDGRQKYYHVNTQQILVDNGVQTGNIFIFLDQTESINAEQMRDSFFCVAAHELRTPISINMNYLAILYRRWGNDNEHREIVEGMQTANRRLIILVNQIISLANLSNSTYDVNHSLTDVKQLIQLKILELRPESEERKIGIIFESRLSETMLSVDPYLLKIAFHNLLSNAIKFNRIGESVRIALEQNRAGTNTILSITITDRGEGISDRARSSLFASFIQGEDPLTRSQGGMGIGLYLVKKATELMGGSIDALSEKGKGSTFTLQVPLS